MSEPKERYVELDVQSIPLATDGLSSPMIYVDAIRGVAISTETTKINLVQFRQNAQTNETVTVHVATLVMPTSQIPAWAQYLQNLTSRPPFVEAEPEGAAKSEDDGAKA